MAESMVKVAINEWLNSKINLLSMQMTGFHEVIWYHRFKYLKYSIFSNRGGCFIIRIGIPSKRNTICFEIVNL